MTRLIHLRKEFLEVFWPLTETILNFDYKNELIKRIENI